MASRAHSPGSDDRAAEGLFSMALLVALVLAGAFVVVLAGSGLLGQLNEETSDTNARVVMQEADSRLATLATSSDTTEAEFSLGSLDEDDVEVVRRGYLNVTVNRNGTCSTNVSMSSLRYEGESGETVAYEAGGVWRQSDENGSSMQTTPDVTFRNGTLDVTLVNLTGRITGKTNPARLNVTASRAETERRNQQLFLGECIRPDNVTVKINSDFYRAWESYLSREMNESATAYPGNETVVVRLGQSDLPRRVDDERNNVVNLSNPGYMDDVTITDQSISIDKDASNTYRVFVEPLAQDRLDIGTISENTSTSNISGPPLDVVFVFDESGSMGQDTNSTDDTPKVISAQWAAQNFTTELNSSTDRVALVGYSSPCCQPGWAGDRTAWIWDVGGSFFTSDFDAFNATVENTADRGGTHGNRGLYKTNVLAHLKSNQTRERVVVYLSDGKNDNDNVNVGGDSFGLNAAGEYRAEVAAEQGMTIYAVGFGKDNSEFNQTFLKEISRITGGSFENASSQDELNDVFETIANRVTTTKQIARIPISTNVTDESGNSFTPQIAGDTDDIAYNVTGDDRYLNVNDPTAPSQFSHSFVVGEGESVHFNGTVFDCAQWRATGVTRSHNGTTYPVTRCTNVTSVDVPVEQSNVSVFTDGEDLGPMLDDDDPAWWQSDLNETLDSHPAVGHNETTEEVELESNQALVVLRYPDGDNSTNMLTLLYEIGRSESEARPSGIVNVRVRNVTVG